jgi:hypothetical protein
MRLVLNTVPMEGVVVIGEGEKDEAPMLFNGEEIGAGGPAVDIAVDPVDGTTLTSLGRNNAIAVIAVAERGSMFNPGPCVYMEKIAVGQEARDVIDLDAPVKANLEAVAKAKGEQVKDVTAVVLDRERHTDIIRECREAGAMVRLIPDGDVMGALETAWPDSGSDILFGIGGTPEGVIAACALKALGRRDPGRLFARNETERRPPSTAATTSSACSRRTTSWRATTCSSRRAASPKATSSAASATAATARAPRRSSCAPRAAPSAHPGEPPAPEADALLHAGVLTGAQRRAGSRGAAQSGTSTPRAVSCDTRRSFGSA